MEFQKTFSNLREGGAKKQTPTLRSILQHVRSIRQTLCRRITLAFRKWTRSHIQTQHSLGLKHYLHETIIPGVLGGIVIAAMVLSFMDCLAKHADNKEYLAFRANVQHAKAQP